MHSYYTPVSAQGMGALFWHIQCIIRFNPHNGPDRYRLLSHQRLHESNGKHPFIGVSSPCDRFRFKPPVCIGLGNGHGHRSHGPALSLGTGTSEDHITRSVIPDDSCRCMGEVQIPVCVCSPCMCPSGSGSDVAALGYKLMVWGDLRQPAQPPSCFPGCPVSLFLAEMVSLNQAPDCGGITLKLLS